MSGEPDPQSEFVTNPKPRDAKLLRTALRRETKGGPRVPDAVTAGIEVLLAAALKREHDDMKSRNRRPDIRMIRAAAQANESVQRVRLARERLEFDRQKAAAAETPTEIVIVTRPFAKDQDGSEHTSTIENPDARGTDDAPADGRGGDGDALPGS